MASNYKFFIIKNGPWKAMTQIQRKTNNVIITDIFYKNIRKKYKISL